MRAVAHPLRLDLLDLLARIGPATAATCARHLGTSQASCSFHLRQLAKYGFVAEAPSSTDQRERPWKIVDVEQQWSPGTPAAAEFERVYIEREAVRMLEWIEGRKHAPEEWRKAGFTSTVTAPMTAEELDELGEAFRKLMEPYADRIAGRAPAPEGARFVRILTNASPLPSTGDTEKDGPEKDGPEKDGPEKDGPEKDAGTE